MKTHLPVLISDTTLRDGEQAPGIAWTCRQKTELLEQLLQSGVDDIEIGMAAHWNTEKAFFKNAIATGAADRLSVFCRAEPLDISLAQKIGAGCIHISVPSSTLSFEALGTSAGQLVRKMEDAFSLARESCERISLGLQDVTRADVSVLCSFAALAKRHGVFRLRLSDTVGIGSPTIIRRLVRKVAHHFNGIIEFHGHNDLGLATANSLAAVEGGASSVSVTVNGIGERAGNAPLEQVVAALQFAAGRSHHVRAEWLVPLSQLVSRMSAERIGPRAPVVGDRIFTVESGMHCRGARKNALMFQPFTPEMIGRTDTMAYAVGKHAGAATVQSLLEGEQMVISHERAREIAASARAIASLRGSSLSLQEVIFMADSAASR